MTALMDVLQGAIDIRHKHIPFHQWDAQHLFRLLYECLQR